VLSPSDVLLFDGVDGAAAAAAAAAAAVAATDLDLPSRSRYILC
jgi:hypothetical protein